MAGLSRIPAWLSGRRGLKDLTGAGLSIMPAWLSGRRGLTGLPGSGLSIAPAWLSGRRGLAGLTGALSGGGTGTDGLSKVPAWLCGRTGLIGLTALLGVGGPEARFNEDFLSSLGGHSTFRNLGGGYFALVSSFSIAGFSGFGGVGFNATKGCEAGPSCLAGPFESLVESNGLVVIAISGLFRVVLVRVGPDILGLGLAASRSVFA